MNVLMATNTYLPHIGGVARSVSSFATELRRMGHRVTVLAPVFDDCTDDEPGVVRCPAIQKYNGGDFSVPMPFAGRIQSRLEDVPIDVVHSHHPFLLGDTALRIGATRAVPVVFTHHTMYEQYTHYVPGDSPRLKHFAVQLVTGYCNLCDAVIAPSETVARVLHARGVVVPVEIIPTGVDLSVFHPGHGDAFRQRFGIPADAYVIGHAGRLAPEKNIELLTRALVRCLATNRAAHALVAGDGVLGAHVRATFARAGLSGRLHMTGSLQWDELCQAYRAMDVFVFASRTETQGMVIAEALASGLPVVALDASGVREVVRDGVNGILLRDGSARDLASALAALGHDRERRAAMSREAVRGAALLSKERMAAKLASLYARCRRRGTPTRTVADSTWAAARRRFAEELKILGNIARAASDAMILRTDHEGRRASIL